MRERFLNVFANFRKHSVVLALILWKTLFAVKVTTNRVAVLDLYLGMFFAEELLGVENKISCKR